MPTFMANMASFVLTVGGITLSAVLFLGIFGGISTEYARVQEESKVEEVAKAAPAHKESPAPRH